MNAKLKNDIDFELRKHLTNGICVSGANISHMKYLLSQKYVSKKKMRDALTKQMEYLEDIQNSKNNILKLLKDE